MICKVKNLIIRIGIALKYRDKKGIVIEKQKKLFEHNIFDFNKHAKVYIKKGLIVKKNVSIRCRDDACLIIGEDVYFNNNCLITCRDEIVIGNKVSFGPNVVIFDHDHDYTAKDRRHTFRTDKITIGDNTWVGASAIILKGSNIGKNCVIAAGAIVNCDIPDDSVYINKNKIKRINYE